MKGDTSDPMYFSLWFSDVIQVALNFAGSGEEQWQVDIVGQAAAETERRRPSRAHLLSDGSPARHSRGIPQVTPFLIPSEWFLLLC